MTTLLFLGSLGTSELIVIVLIVLLLFGGKKIPEMMKGMGQGVRSFKEGMNGMKEEISKTPTTEETKEEKKDK
ncbi:MAG: twin-arginine translocase TatA/TatE family subunit [Rikenellaceae bacterium]